MTADARISERRHRTAAAALVAVVATAIAAGAHALAGGGLPSIATLAIALLLSVAVGILAIGPRLTRARTAVGVLADQLLFHSVFAFFGPASAMGGPIAAHDHAHSAGTMLSAGAPAAVAMPVAAMAASHLGAALLAYGMLRSGIRAVETVLRALARAVARALRRPHRIAFPTLPRPVAVTLVARVRAVQLRLPDGRGPPALAAA